MADAPKSSVDVNKWPGLMTNADPHNLPAGAAQEQVNIQSLVPGQADVRKGIQRDPNFSGSVAQEIITVYRYTHALGDFLVTVDTNGYIKAIKGGVTKTIKTGASFTWPWSFNTTRSGDLIGVNGLQRGIRWDGYTAAAEDLGLKAPTSSPGVVIGDDGNAIDGSYVLCYRFVDNTLPKKICSALSPPTTVSGDLEGKEFNWTVVSADASPDATRTTSVELWRSTADAPNVLYFVAADLTGSDTTYTDQNSDATLVANAVANPDLRLVVLGPDGSVLGRRQGVPPDTKRVLAHFQDRMYYGADASYTTGTVTTDGDDTIVGSGTAWTSDMAGRFIYIDGETAPLTIEACGSATSITLDTAALTSASGKSYSIKPSPAERNALYFSYPNEPESVLATNMVTIQENTDDDDEIVGIYEFGSLLYIAKERHTYSIGGCCNPAKESNPRLINNRGLVNFRCRAVLEGKFYGLDQLGVYIMSPGGELQDISGPIQDKFRKGRATLDWANREWWFALPDPTCGLVRFFVGYAADSTTRPKRVLVFSTKTGAWWEEHIPWSEIGGGAVMYLSGEACPMLGSDSDDALAMNTGETDFISAEVTGTTTGSDSTSLFDTTNNPFLAGHIGAPVAVIDGTGKRQIRTITARPLVSDITISPAWTTNPVAGDKFIIGAVEWKWKGGVNRWAQFQNDNPRRLEILSQTVATQAYMDARFYSDRSATAENFDVAVATGPGESVATTRSDPNAVCDLTKTDGYHRVSVSGLREGSEEGSRYVEVELRGYKGNSAQKLYQLHLRGAVDEATVAKSV